jgi:hypothetical protein
MTKIAEVLDRNFGLHAGVTQMGLSEQLQSKLDDLTRLFSELEKQPEFREYVKFAVEWQKLEYELRALQCKIRERVAAEPVNKANELLRKLVRKG